MSIWSRIKEWFTAGQWPRDTRKMTTQELEDEYRMIYRRVVLLGYSTAAEDFRLSLIEDRLKDRGVYISKGVDCYFSESVK